MNRRPSARQEPDGVEYRPGTVRLVAPVILAAALIVAACSSGGAARPATTSSSLDGRTFLSTKMEGHDLVKGTTVRMTFKDGRIGISAGCNQMSGAYAIDGGRLTIGQMAMTEMGCDPALMAQDTWVGGFVDGATVTLAGDTLTLAQGGVTMTLVDRKVADPDRPLQGTHWGLDGIVSGDAVSSVPTGGSAGLTIKDGKLQVETGCNTGIATVEVSDKTLTIGPMVLTKKACAPDATAVQQAMTTVLSGTVRYTIEADLLTLTAGPAGLMLRAGS